MGDTRGKGSFTSGVSEEPLGFGRTFFHSLSVDPEKHFSTREYTISCQRPCRTVFFITQTYPGWLVTVTCRGAPDSTFYYPPGYPICRIVEKTPAGYRIFLYTRLRPSFQVEYLNCLKKYGVFTIFWLETMGKKPKVFSPRAQRCSTCMVEKWQVFSVIETLVEH